MGPASVYRCWLAGGDARPTYMDIVLHITNI
jgi:hypothetical protein